MKYKLVIFDFDGTLADSFPWAMTIINDVADQYGIRRVADSEVESLRGMSVKAVAKHLRVPWYKVPRIAHSMRKMMLRDIDRIPLMDGVDQLLARLSENGVQMAVVSSNTSDNVRRVLGPENAKRIAIFECGVALLGKAGRFRKVLRRCKVKAADALAIGDELRDLEAANKAKIPFGAVSWGYNLPESFQAHAPRAVFGTVKDIEIEVMGK
jgi:phosphoglycolate phosphatase